MSKFSHLILTCIPLAVLLAIYPIQAGFCVDCSNLDRACSHIKNKDSSIPKCCKRDRDSSAFLKCDVTDVEQIGTCVEGGGEEEEKDKKGNEG